MLGLNVKLDSLMRRSPAGLGPVERLFRVMQESYVSIGLEADLNGYMAERQLEYLLRDMKTIKEHDPGMWKKLTRTVRDGDDARFHSGRFEASLVAPLILNSIKFEKTDPPDFTIPTADGDIFIEATSRRLRMGSSPNVRCRLQAAIAEKSKKGYAGVRTALCVDFTNLAFHTFGTGEQMDASSVRSIATESAQVSPFGSIVLAGYQFSRDSTPPEYKSSRIKQYFKEDWALRTETVICNSRDFGVGRRVCAENWNALRAAGEMANRCLCEAEAADAMPAPDVVTFNLVARPSKTDDGLHAPAIRFGDQRVMAVLASLQ